jgi:dienelactone hydrolase
VFTWAQWLKAEGYVALVVDSFSPRGTTNVCRTLSNPTAYEVAGDAFGALAYLRSLPFVDRERIGVIGWSYGAMASLIAAGASFSKSVQPPGGGFRVAVPFYPSCSYLTHDTAIPVLLLLGEADDWTPPDLCVATAQELRNSGRTALWQVYPGATHGFDKAELENRTVTYLGHTMRYDPAATADAEKRLRAFLTQYLRRSQQ